MSQQVAIAIHKVPDRDGSYHTQNRAYGGWVWIGPKRFVPKVIKALNTDASIADAIQSGVELRACPDGVFTPAQLRRIEAEVRDRLENGPSVPGGFEGEPWFGLPCAAVGDDVEHRDVYRHPVLIPGPGQEYAWDLVQRAAELAETAWSILKDQVNDGAAKSPAPRVPRPCKERPGIRRKSTAHRERRKSNAMSSATPTPTASGNLHKKSVLNPVVHRESNAGECLRALVKLNADYEERAVKTSKLVASFKSQSSPESYKKVISKLRKMGLVETSYNGVWLTKAGKTKAANMNTDKAG